jgi:hypothetical protein
VLLNVGNELCWNLMMCIICSFSWFQIQLAEHENELIEMNANSEKLRQSYNELLEFKIVLQKVNLLAYIYIVYAYI